MADPDPIVTDPRYHPLAKLTTALMRQVWESTEEGERLDTLAVARGILGNPELLDALATHHGWRPPVRVIETREALDALVSSFCVIREIPADPLEFYPAIWEMGFQTGWCRAGVEYRSYDCEPRLPVEVLVEPEANRG